MPALPSGAVARGRARRERRALRTAWCGSAVTRRRPNRRRFASGEAGLRATDARPRPHATRGKSRHGRDSWLGQRRCRTFTTQTGIRRCARPEQAREGHPDEGRAGYGQQSRLARANCCAKVVRSGLERALRKPDRSRYGGSRTLCREGRAPRQRRRVRTPRRFQLRLRLVDDPGELGEGVDVQAEGNEPRVF